MKGANTDPGGKEGDRPFAAESVIAPATPPLPPGVPGGQPDADVAAAAADTYPDGPNVEASPWELDAARGKLPKPPE